MTDVAEIARLLAVYDAAAKDCPARKQFLGYSPCPKCRATPRDRCGLDTAAAYAFIDATRAHLTQEQPR